MPIFIDRSAPIIEDQPRSVRLKASKSPDSQTEVAGRALIEWDGQRVAEVG